MQARTNWRNRFVGEPAASARWSAFIVLALVVLVGGYAVVHRGHAATTTWSFDSSGLDAAGFQNVAAYSPFKDANGKRPLLVGADIAGVHRSLDDGQNWLPANVGLGDHHIAGLMWSQTTAGTVYAASEGGVFKSTDFGLHWAKKAGEVDFQANNEYKSNSPNEHPRGTGNMLAQETSGGTTYLFAATSSEGIKRSSDDGAIYDKAALVGDHLRSVAVDPDDPNTVFVAAAHAGLYVSHNALSTMTFSLVPGSPDTPEELYWVDGQMYIAANTAGMYRYDGTLHAINNGVGTSGPAWESIVGYKSGSNVILYAGAANVSGASSVIKSTDGGSSWVSISKGTGVTVHNNFYGSSLDWWASGSSYLHFNSGSFVAAQIVLNPDNLNSITIAGRGGVTHGTVSGNSYDWYPAGRGLMATVNNEVVTDPKSPSRVYIASMDYTFLASTDHGTTITNPKPAGAPTTGDYIALDSSTAAGKPSAVYLAASDRGQQNNGTGALWSNPDPVTTPAAWIDENLPVDNDVLALGVGHQGSGGPIILVSIRGSGLYRKAGGTWSKVSGTAPFGGGSYGTIKWPTGTNKVYAADGSGIWRSTDAGATWTKLGAASAGYDSIDELVVDPADPSRIYVSDNSQGGVARVDNADANASITKILSIGNPGPLAIESNGNLFVHDRSGRLMYSTNPDASGASFTNVADSYYHDNNDGIRSLAVSNDGYIYTANNSAGVSEGTPSTVTGTNTPTTTTTVTATPSATSTPTASPTASPTTPGDVNGDHKVNITDLSLLTSHWGTNYPAADFNNDHSVGITDLSILLSHWTGS